MTSWVLQFISGWYLRAMCRTTNFQRNVHQCWHVLGRTTFLRSACNS